jgi:hypothetical protein
MGGVRADFVLHPLIHTSALATMVLHVGTGQKRRECGLKYVIHTPGRHEKSGAEAPLCSLKNG